MMRFASILPAARPRNLPRGRGLGGRGLGGGVEEHALTAAGELQAATEGLRAAERRAKDPKAAADCLGAMRAYFDARSAGNRALSHMAEVEEQYATLYARDKDKAQSMRNALDLNRLAEEAEAASRAARQATERCLEQLARGQMRQRYEAVEEEAETRATVQVRRQIIDI